MTELHEPLSSYDDEEAPGAMLEAPVGDVPRRTMIATSPAAKIATVINEMNEKSVGCALVVDNGEVESGRLVGIFTERDVLRKVAASGMDTRTATVAEVMTPDPDTLPSGASIAFALNLMSVEGFRHVPLIDHNDQAIGVVGMRDIINWIVDMYPSRVLNVPPAPSSHPKTREGA